MKFLRALFVVTLVLAFAVPAFAETQNVKVSGSIDAYWFYRSDFDMAENNDSGAVPAGTAVQAGGGATGDLDHRSEGDNFFMSTTQVEVSADLTDNVSTVINLVNERDWNADMVEAADASGTANNAGAEFSVLLDLAYVQMKEIFYSPLTLTVGRQDLWFGRGFVIGNNNRAWDNGGTLLANEYSAQTAFDAVRATLDFNPWTLDFVYSNLEENARDPEDDLDLYIANVNYKFAEYNAVAEGYWVAEIDKATNSTLPGIAIADNQTHTIGGRVQFDPISQITLGGEIAYQGGDYYSAQPNQSHRERDAWALDLFGTYRWDYTWKPEVTVEYVHFSGEETTGANSIDDYNAWNGLYRGKFWTAYADFREFVYATRDAVDQPATTNSQFVQVKGAIKPLEDLLLEGAFTYLWNDENVLNADGVTQRDEEIGWEIDLQVTYDYTEDVSFGVLAGWFTPGEFYDVGVNNDADVTDIVSSVKVTF